MQELLFHIGSLIPMVILFLGLLFLSIAKKYNFIFFAVIGLFLLENISFLDIWSIKGESSWTLYLSAPLYFSLIHNLYNHFSYDLLTRGAFSVLLIVVLIIAIVSILFIRNEDVNFVFYFIASVDLIIMLYPLNYLLKLANQTVKYESKFFILNSMVLFFFSLEIVLYVMMKFLSDHYSLISTGVVFFRFFIIQLFYITLIYSGCKLIKN